MLVPINPLTAISYAPIPSEVDNLIPRLRATYVSAIQHFSDLGSAYGAWYERLPWGLELNHVNIPIAQCVNRYRRKKTASSRQVRFYCQKVFLPNLDRKKTQNLLSEVEFWS